MTILSFTHPQVILNLYEFLSPANIKQDIWENDGN